MRPIKKISPDFVGIAPIRVTESILVGVVTWLICDRFSLSDRMTVIAICATVFIPRYIAQAKAVDESLCHPIEMNAFVVCQHGEFWAESTNPACIHCNNNSPGIQRLNNYKIEEVREFVARLKTEQPIPQSPEPR